MNEKIKHLFVNKSKDVRNWHVFPLDLESRCSFYELIWFMTLINVAFFVELEKEKR